MSDKIIHLTDSVFEQSVLKANGPVLVDFGQPGVARVK